MPEIGKDDPEMAYRRGYEYGATQTFQAVEQFLDPAARERPADVAAPEDRDRSQRRALCLLRLCHRGSSCLVRNTMIVENRV